MPSNAERLKKPEGWTEAYVFIPPEVREALRIWAAECGINLRAIYSLALRYAASQPSFLDYVKQRSPYSED